MLRAVALALRARHEACEHRFARATVRARVRDSVFGWEKLRESLATAPQATDAPSTVSGVTGGDTT